MAQAPICLFSRALICIVATRSCSIPSLRQGGSTGFHRARVQWNPDRIIARRLPARGDIASWRGEKPPLSADGHRGCLASASGDSLGLSYLQQHIHRVEDTLCGHLSACSCTRCVVVIFFSSNSTLTLDFEGHLPHKECRAGQGSRLRGSLSPNNSS